MLQVATFKISSSWFSPSQQEEANEFLKTYKPVGNINLNKDTIVVFWEDDPAADSGASMQDPVKYSLWIGGVSMVLT